MKFYVRYYIYKEHRSGFITLEIEKEGNDARERKRCLESTKVVATAKVTTAIIVVMEVVGDRIRSEKTKGTCAKTHCSCACHAHAATAWTSAPHHRLLLRIDGLLGIVAALLGIIAALLLRIRLAVRLLWLLVSTAAAHVASAFARTERPIGGVLPLTVCVWGIDVEPLLRVGVELRNPPFT